MCSRMLAAALLLAACARADDTVAQRWQKLIDTKQYDEARKVCTRWLSAADKPTRAEAYKCLANVVLAGNDIIFLQGDDAKGGSMGGSYTRKATDKAIAFLNQGLKVAPQDLSIHQGRLHLLEVSARYDEMAQALDESCKVYQGPGVPGAWVAYTYELFDIRQYRAAVALLKVLEKHFPDSHDVIGNLGAVYSTLRQDDLALSYLRHAVELAPTDPLDAWNLGRAYDRTDGNELADRWYKKALALDKNDDGAQRERKCWYAGFVQRKLHDAARACELQKADCEPEEQTACEPPK